MYSFRYLTILKVLSRGGCDFMNVVKEKFYDLLNFFWVVGLGLYITKNVSTPVTELLTL